MQFSLTDTSDTEYTGSMESYIHALHANFHRLFIPLEFENFTTSTKSTCPRSMDILTTTWSLFLICANALQELKIQFIHSARYVKRNVTESIFLLCYSCNLSIHF